MSEYISREIGVVISDIPERTVLVLAGIEPKYKCKNKLIQKLLLKWFGEKPVFKGKRAKVLELKADDYPYLDFDGNFTIDFESNIEKY